ncbi:hypothetical protein PE067_10525 [Paracoccus sp. DMF-8]|uniref:hypothetical protein n=1 Tax=Paracoccus sp. DMF-8 TaxID=3019445 RepID=UPI0023E89F4C|nr:hypothetical protein [Paracoccus sp. DMF-8]MDF3606535.1 hypothetical protein [Paracoccus sp. DMF-8]
MSGVNTSAEMPKPKPMTLLNQAELIEYIIRRAGDARSGDAMVWLCQQHIDDLTTISKTLRVMSLFKADQFVKAESAKQKKQRSGQ